MGGSGWRRRHGSRLCVGSDEGTGNRRAARRQGSDARAATSEDRRQKGDASGAMSGELGGDDLVGAVQGDRDALPGQGLVAVPAGVLGEVGGRDRKSTRLNSSHVAISYAVFCLKKKT